ncbi:PREDICTED: double-stranded RNA-binding protein 1-like isoform X3 [Populus euphratica]|uniref:Double-stranded RNA-binding protein 1-like isoform X3 n=1 Tax=Populus euphratica TaxID=75702 RepID=A0AAJ6URT7_POPEU|nr:PREDICTED: double-stranded RNA-binding protein 1-like isoform X3 [Populus euphratica]
MYKSKLQELCQQRAWELPTYESSRQGQAHNPRFLATVTVNDIFFHSPSPANTSKKAQNDAAKLAYEHFSIPRPSPSPSPSLSVAAGSLGERAGAITCLSPGGTSQFNTQDANRTSQINVALAVAKNDGSFGVAAGSLSVSTRANGHLSLRGSLQLNTQNANQTPQVNEATTVARNDESSGDMQRLFKSQLQTYAQKRNFALPVYSCERVGPPHSCRFKCKVTVNGQTFESLEYFPTLSKAEHAAAKAALMSLLPNGVEEDESGYKNLLQELAQREGCGLPTYSTNKSGEAHVPTFISTVEIEGEIFTGQGAKTKKQAEMSAAKTAYTALKQRNSSPSPAFLSPACQFQEAPQSSKLLTPACQVQEAVQSTTCHSPAHQGHEALQLSTPSLLADLTAYLQQNIQPKLPVPIEQDEEGRVCSEIRSRHPFIASSGQDSVSAVTSITSSSDVAISSLPEHDLSPSSLPSDSSTSSAANSSIEHIVGRSTTCQSRIIVHPRGATVTYPSGTTVLPISDGNWVAVKIPTQPSQ